MSDPATDIETEIAARLFPFPQAHFLAAGALNRLEAERLLELADSYVALNRLPQKRLATLRGKTLVNLFFENSTRTQSSFEVAAKRLGADVIAMSPRTSSMTKGETLIDTAVTLNAMRPDLLVVRHSASGAAALLSQKVSCSVINAGDGQHEHPTQGLLDMMTMREHKGDIEGLKVCIIGDLLHSRVARSNVFGLLTMGADLTLCGPHTLLPQEFGTMNLKMTTDADEAVEEADVVMTLRLQNERMNGAYLPSVREFARLYGINAKRLKRAKPDAIVMHPGPINRGVEIADDVADSAQSVILNQVTNGVAVRMAVLYHLLGGNEDNE